MLLSVGERISMSLVSMALQDLGTPAISFTGSTEVGRILAEDLRAQGVAVSAWDLKLASPASAAPLRAHAAAHGVVLAASAAMTAAGAMAPATHPSNINKEILDNVRFPETAIEAQTGQGDHRESAHAAA